MKRDYTTAVVIRAIPTAVWKVLIDTAGYAGDRQAEVDSFSAALKARVEAVVG